MLDFSDCTKKLSTLSSQEEPTAINHTEIFLLLFSSNVSVGVSYSTDVGLKINIPGCKPLPLITVHGLCLGIFFLFFLPGSRTEVWGSVPGTEIVPNNFPCLSICLNGEEIPHSAALFQFDLSVLLCCMYKNYTTKKTRWKSDWFSTAGFTSNLVSPWIPTHFETST